MDKKNYSWVISFPIFWRHSCTRGTIPWNAVCIMAGSRLFFELRITIFNEGDQRAVFSKYSPLKIPIGRNNKLQDQGIWFNFFVKTVNMYSGVYFYLKRMKYVIIWMMYLIPCFWSFFDVFQKVFFTKKPISLRILGGFWKNWHQNLS